MLPWLLDIVTQNVAYSLASEFLSQIASCKGVKFPTIRLNDISSNLLPPFSACACLISKPHPSIAISYQNAAAPNKPGYQPCSMPSRLFARNYTLYPTLPSYPSPYSHPSPPQSPQARPAPQAEPFSPPQ